ncbi:MAG: beta-lactamase family protein [Deltaproteobacteria bacterium]|nr:beta-lactamase family protein [Deltaproteobacteria bacterium]
MLLLPLCSAAAAPVSQRLLRENVQAAARYSREVSQISLLVSQQGRVLFEEHRASPKAGYPVASCAKSLWGLAAAAAVQDGLLSFDELVCATFPGWEDDPRKARVRVRDLLSMTSGLDPGYEPLYSHDPEDAHQTALALPAINEPGELFVYGPANMEVFGALLAKKLARRGLSPLRYLEKRVLEPTGAGYTGWSRDKVGHPMMSSGVQMTARQLLAVGRLIAHRGAVGGRRLVSASALGELFQGTPANPAYGMTLWLNANARLSEAVETDIEKTLGLGRPHEGWSTACVSKAAPPDLVVMVGSWNQRVYVSPSLDLVIVRQGSGTRFSDAEFLSRLFKGE